ncbi:hypothetical protein [Oerskovia paurometabola]|uniref:hypothetical protein n=1 Tax=Oerskovia paurometabola TaxID=162170 RepID=UPI0034193EBC
MSTPAPLTLAQLNALPTGSVVRYATERGMRPAVALKVTNIGPDRSKWHSSDSMAPVSSLTIASNNPVLLAPAPPEPTTFATPGDLRTWLYETDIVEPFSHLLRDAHQRPWIVAWSEDDPFVISYPEGDENGELPKPSTYHSDLDLPVYPVRLIQEAGA